MKKFIRLVLPFLAIGMLSGCDLIKIDNGGGGNNDKAAYAIADPDFSERQIADKESVTYEDLFNLHNKVSISVEVDREEMQKINDDNVYSGDFDTIKPETYHLAKKFTLTLVNGSNSYTWELENVGIRQKGNTSRKPIFEKNGKLYNKNHFKFNFQETFDDPAKYSAEFIEAHGNQEYKNREILGLSGIDIKWNKTDDTTHLKEIYSNMLLRSAGIMAQHVGLSTMKMIYDGDKEANFGLCYIYEQTNKELIKRSLQSETSYIGMSSWKEEKEGTHGVEGSKYGDLYKASYGKGDGGSSGANFTTGSISGKRLGVRTDIEGRNYPTYERKTDKKADYNDTQMRELVRALASSPVSYSKVEEKVDLEYLAMEEAVMYFLGNPDSMKYNYNNYMVYFRRTDGKMIIIPIDNDRCFGVGNGWMSGLTRILDSKCKPLSEKPLNGDQANPLLREVLFSAKDNQAKKNYKTALELVRKSTWLTNETFERYYNILKETYKDLSTFSLDGGLGNMSFASYVQVKKNIYDGNEPGEYTINDESAAPEYFAPAFPKDVPLYAIGSANSWKEDITEQNKDLFLFTFSDDGSTLSATFPVLADKYAPEPNRMQFYIQDLAEPGEQPIYTFGVASPEMNNPDHIYMREEGEFYPSVIECTAVVGDTVRIVIDVDSGAFVITVNP